MQNQTTRMFDVTLTAVFEAHDEGTLRAHLEKVTAAMAAGGPLGAELFLVDHAWTIEEREETPE
jgi:hypothetical protein